MSIKYQVLKKIPKGRKNQIHSRELELVFNITGRQLRRIINKLRSEGHPILSNEDGYWISSSKKEIEEFREMMIAKAKESIRIVNAIKGLKK